MKSLIQELYKRGPCIQVDLWWYEKLQKIDGIDFTKMNILFHNNLSVFQYWRLEQTMTSDKSYLLTHKQDDMHYSKEEAAIKLAGKSC